MHIDSHRIFDQLPLLSLCVVDIDDAGGDGEELCQLRGAEASRSGDDLEAFRVRADSDGLNEAVLPDAFGVLFR
jgi:hypothetical protein